MKKIIIILAILLSSCGAKKKQTERLKIKEVTAFEVQKKEEKNISIESETKTITLTEGETVEIEADSTGVVTKETKGNKTIFTGAKKITIKKENKKEEVDNKVEINQNEKKETKAEGKTTKQETKRTSNSTTLRFNWWLLVLILVIGFILMRFKRILKYFGIPIR
jgi:ATP-dependent Zn protease